MITFKVDNVTFDKFRALEYYTKDSKTNLTKLVGLGMEGSSDSDSQLTDLNNNLIASINNAYGCHLPLALSPDIIWLTIAQGLSLHINNNSEELRHQFVDFEGKENIEIDENSFVKGSQNNDWSHAFGQFSDKIAEYIGKKRDLIVGDYSTSTVVTRAANEIVLMEAMQKYFTYQMNTACGIPEITLLGTVDDWKALKTRVVAMSEFNLSWWTNQLEPIVDEFISASQGNVNLSFWQNIYKESGGSGGPYLSGWITHLFPYLRDRKFNYTLRNEFGAGKRGMFGGLTTDSFPNGISKVPFIWNYYGTKFEMELAAGFTGFKFEDNMITPNIGWAVRDKNSQVSVGIKPTKNVEKIFGSEEQMEIKIFLLKAKSRQLLNKSWNEKVELLRLIPDTQVIVLDENDKQ